MKYRCLLLSFFISAIVFSQGNRSLFSRIHYVASAGIAGGESSPGPLAQFSGGIKYSRYFTGIGVGVDGYRFYSLPVFADWKIFVGKKNQGFAYADAGYNIALYKKLGEIDGFKTTDRHIGGFYMDAGIGSRLAVGEKHHFLFSAGYSLKHMRNVIGYTYPCLVAPCPETIYDDRYQLGRIVAKLGWEFGKSAAKKK